MRPCAHTDAPLMRLVIRPTTTFRMTADNTRSTACPAGTKDSMTGRWALVTEAMTRSEACSGRSSGRDDECLGVRLAVVLGQHGTHLTGPVRDGLPADMATHNR